MRYELVSVRTSHDGAARIVSLPGGALSARVAVELAAAAEELVEDRDVRAVLLCAAGPDFCSGSGDDLDPVAIGVDPAAALARVRVPIVVALSGRCWSVGLELALAGDIFVAAPDVTLRLDDARAGRLPCWGGSQRLPRAVGRSRATAMMLLGDVLSAADAAAAGMVWQVVDEPVAAAEALVAGLVALGPLALEYAKEAVHRGAELPLRDGLRLEGDLNTLLATSADRAEGLAAFFAKRPPDFAGR